ncbi:MAG: hypothetical protein KDA84_09225, partial [Planctomycetaceae bacterium]|nr:hypothetical protein [Planctomycetaceae bacterium]
MKVIIVTDSNSDETTYEIRNAVPGDWETIVEYNVRLAIETENKTLDRETVIQGVKALLDDATKGRYFVAVSEGQI